MKFGTYPLFHRGNKNFKEKDSKKFKKRGLGDLPQKGGFLKKA